MKTAKIQRLLGSLLLAGILLTGCSKDNSLTETTKPDEKKETTDAFLLALQAIDGVHNVRMEVSEYNDTVYCFDFHQLVDHKNPVAGYFDQQVAINFKGYDKDVVLHTHGYTMGDINRYSADDLTVLLGANQVDVEHRYFGTSLPEPADRLSFAYFNAEQQAYDLHTIVQTLKQHLFKTGRWASTGTSKNGITSALYAYYSDLNGWSDINLYVPFCAPFLPGSTAADGTFSCMDISPGVYIDQVCGTGYTPGSAEDIACQRLRDIPRYICTNNALRSACNRRIMVTKPTEYRKIVEQYNQQSPMSTGNLEKDLTALTLYTYSECLFTKFSYIQFPLWASLVPDPAKAATNNKELEHLLTFITMDDGNVRDSLMAMHLREEQTRNSFTDYYDRLWNYLKTLRSDHTTTPYYVQAFMELGANEYAFQYVDGTFLTAQQVRDVNYLFSPQNMFANVLRQDEGQLMRNFLQWVGTETTQPIVFVYAHNDPWTGGRPDDAAVSQNPNVQMVIDPIAVHNDLFLNPYMYTAETKRVITDAVNRYMK